MTIIDMYNIKKQLDEACEAIASEVNLEGSDILVVYHGHYEKIAFSMFEEGRFETHEAKTKSPNCIFFKSEDVDTIAYERITDEILKLITEKEI